VRWSRPASTYLRPDADALPDCNGIGMFGSFFRRCQNVQAAEDDFGAPAPIPVGQLVGALRECQMDRDSDDFGKRI
jgi:hypothetical protein